MNILVCVKQVPDMESAFHVAADGSRIEEEHLVWRMNEYDRYAVEQALLLKDRLTECTVTALSLGPDRVVEVITKALAMGCDNGVHIADSTGDVTAPLDVAEAIAAHAKEQTYDLILTGMQSEDLGSGMVGVLIGEILSLPSITGVVSFELANGQYILTRELEQGMRASVTAPSPAVITCQTGLNTPRYPTFPNIMKARNKPLRTRCVTTLLPTSRQQQEVSYSVPEKPACTILEGPPEHLAQILADMLRPYVHAASLKGKTT